MNIEVERYIGKKMILTSGKTFVEFLLEKKMKMWAALDFISQEFVYRLFPGIFNRRKFFRDISTCTDEPGDRARCSVLEHHAREYIVQH